MIDIKKKTAELINQNIDLSEEATQALFDIGLLECHTCKKVLIRQEFHERSRSKMKEEIKMDLADKYCVSLSTINKYLAEERNM